MIEWFAKNHVAANILMLAIISAGLYSAFYRTPISAFPTFEPGVVQVYTGIPGASPEDVEKGVTIRIEQAFYDLPGIDEIYSVSREGTSLVNAKINYNFDTSKLRDEIQSRVFEITTLPETALQPVIFEQVSRNQVIEVVLYGDASVRELRDYADVLYDELFALPSVSQALIDDSQKYEIVIEIPQLTLEAYQLDLEQIARKIDANSGDFSAGNIHTRDQDILLRSQPRAYRHDEFSQLVIDSHPDGSIIRLGDIATIHDSFEADQQAIVRFNGKPATVVRIFRSDQEDVIAIADEVKQYIAEKQLPDNLELSFWRDRSSVVKKRLGTLTTSALQGMVLVLLMLSLFLRPMVAAWVFVGVPVSILGTIAVLPWLGVNINLISMLGFILLLGIVVDDAIVTGESIYYHLSRGQPPLQAAIDGTHAVAVPVTFGVLTTVAAFASMVVLSQGTGLVVIFAALPAVIVPALLFSLVESKLVLPAHLSRIKYDPAKEQSSFARFQRRFSNKFEALVRHHYPPLLAGFIRHRYATMVGFLGLFIITLLLVGKNWLNFNFFPRVEGEVVFLRVLMPTGSAPEVTRQHGAKTYQVAEQLQDKYRDPETGQSIIPKILELTANTQARTYMEVIPPEERNTTLSMRELVNEWREEIGELPGSKYVQLRSEIIRVSDPVNIQFRGEDIEQLVEIAELCREKLLSYPGVFDIADNFSEGKEQLRIELNQVGHSLGLTRRSLLSQVRAAHYGFEAQRIQRGRDDVRVKVRLPDSERTTFSDLRQLRIRLPNGRYVNLAEVAELTPAIGSADIQRVDLKRAINIYADIDKSKVNLNQLYQNLTPWLDQVLINYPLVSYSFEGEFADQNTAFGLLFFGVGMALFVIYAMLAIPLKSFFFPLIILSVIPFSLIGVVFGHWLLNFDMTVISLLGMIGLIGVVVNDSLLISVYIIRHSQRGENLLRSVVSAGIRRFRPVFLTTLTTFIGLLPILLEKSTQARFLIPMAVSLSIGILFASTITLIQVPLLFVIAEDVKKWFRRKWHKLTSASTDAGSP